MTTPQLSFHLDHAPTIGIVAAMGDEAMTPEQKRQAETIMKEILRESVEHALGRLKLLP